MFCVLCSLKYCEICSSRRSEACEWFSKCHIEVSTLHIYDQLWLHFKDIWKFSGILSEHKVMQYNLKLLSLFVQFDSHLLELSFSREIQTNSKTLIKNVFPESAKEIVHTIQWLFQLGKEICQRVCSRNLFYVIIMSYF